MGVWSRYSGLRKQLVRSSFDVYRAVEQRLTRIGRPPRDFGQGRSFAKVDTHQPLVALTFDDGPHPENTPRLLDILAEHEVRASFYLIGELVRRYPELARMTAEQGHEIGNHTWSHRFLTLQSTRSIEDELGKTHEAIKDATGSPPHALRPPYGAVTPAMTRWIDHRFGYPTVTWSVDAEDWEEPEPETIRERVLSRVHPGSIVLLHDPLTPTVDAIAGMLDGLLKRGFGLVTVGELIAPATVP